MVTTKVGQTTQRIQGRMLCCGRKKTGREAVDLATSPRRLPNQKQLPPMVVQPDFRKVSGISSEMFRQIETIENEGDPGGCGSALGNRGEMLVRVLDPKGLGATAAAAARPWLSMGDGNKGHARLVEIVKRPGQTLGLYIREGNGIDRSDGVFISRIALESSVYNSGCLKVGDEILAVNMVDVTRMSLDDVVIIMSIPRRLILVTREGSPCPVGVQSQPHHKPLPVVVMKGQIGGNRDPSPCKLDDDRDRPSSRLQASRSHLALGLSGGGHHDMSSPSERLMNSGSSVKRTMNGSLGSGYYNQHLTHSHTSHVERGSWLYQPPPPPVVTEQPTKSHHHHHYQPPISSFYDKSHQNTLESLAEKVSASVHSFYPGGSSTTPRRMSATTSSSLLSYYGGSSRSKIMPRSGSDQHLPRVEYMDYGVTRDPPAYRTPNYSRSVTSSGSNYGTLSRRQRPVDYSSDTETSNRPYYYFRQHSAGNPPPSSLDHAASRISSLRSNSLPRDTRSHVSRSASSGHHIQLGSHRGSGPRIDRDLLLSSAVASLVDNDDDGALSAPEMTLSRKRDEYRSWLSRAPSSSAIYQSTASRGISGSSSCLLGSQKASQRFAFSSENLPQRTRQSELLYSTYRPGQLAAMSSLVSSSASPPIKSTTLDRMAFLDRSSTFNDRMSSTLDRRHASPSAFSMTLDRHHSSALTSRSASLRRMHNLLELEAKSMGKGSTPIVSSSMSTEMSGSSKPRSHTSSLLHINPAEFLKYKQSVIPRSSSSVGLSGLSEVSGLLWLHLLSGRGLRASSSSSGSSTNLTAVSTAASGSVIRDLYCVLECDGVHKARTVVRTADLVFDWDETFELDLVSNRELDFLIYSWDPQYRHKLCYKGSIQLTALLQESPVHQLAVKIEPRGTLYLRLHHTNPSQTFSRRPRSVGTTAPKPALFGADLEILVNRESIASEIMKGEALNVPTIVRRCVEEVERRGLDIIGLYRLCGSATKKRILREAFERSPRTVDLSSDNVPDINVITGVLKDYLRELPEPLVTKCLYQMLADAVSVCLPDDPQGNASLIFSILDCLPHVNRCTFVYLMNHLALVASQQERNKMSTSALSICFAPVLVLHSDSDGSELDFHGPISVIKYLLDIWPSSSLTSSFTATSTDRAPLLPPRPGCSAPAPPPLPAKPKPQVFTSQVPKVVTSPITPPSSSDDEYAKSTFDAKANFDSKKSVFERAGQTGASGPIGPNFNTRTQLEEETRIQESIMAAVTSSSSPPKYTLKVNRNNPFAEDMEAVTPSSSTTDRCDADADGENSDDSTNQINLK